MKTEFCFLIPTYLTYEVLVNTVHNQSLSLLTSPNPALSQTLLKACLEMQVPLPTP